MYSKIITTTFSQIGLHPVTPGFPAGLVEVRAAPAQGLAFKGIKKSEGWADDEHQTCTFEFFNPETGKALNGTKDSKILRLYGENDDGDVVVLLEATLHSRTDTQVFFDVTKKAYDIQVRVKCERRHAS